ncbi:DNA-binding protein [Streptomyces sp. JJ66]|uniref:DNA-binding protein n=1 Tax=Streptomyces sp. JJ66 TaxID=2803843 RepID=UPI001C594C1A|nr:DNA-binding protein [Streptomyces sp. JJ66]MBW1602019.1 DNA-binding protein [Streptomyces sp. JJ66]
MTPAARELAYACRVRQATRGVLVLEARAGAVTAAPVAARLAPRFLCDPRRPADGGLRPGSEAGAALAELTQVAGWLLFDAEQQRAAHRFSTLALTLARASGDRASERLVLATLAMQAAHLGRPGAALRLSGTALTAPRLTPRVAAVFRLRQAQAHALGGRRAAALRAVRHAHSLVLDGPADRDPAWVWWVDEVETAGHLGLTYAALGAWHRAVDQLTAVTGAGGFRALFDAELLAAQLRCGAWRDAAALAADLAARADRLQSARATRVLHRALRPLLTAPPTGPTPPAAVREAAHWLDAHLRVPHDGTTGRSS